MCPARVCRTSGDRSIGPGLGLFSGDDTQKTGEGWWLWFAYEIDAISVIAALIVSQ